MPAPCRSERADELDLDGAAARERGSATLVGLALSVFLLLTGVLAVDVGALAGARAAAQTAADLAALAALTHAAAGLPAERSREVARANGAELASCACSPLEATVTVRRQARLLPATTVQVIARARGPPRRLARSCGTGSSRTRRSAGRGQGRG